ncbi:MAG TPA: ribonuclease P protein component [Opitutaceae bacterium]|nr:ribonuclease P protein component [Opitutaceae bacterium]HND59844.1 ribonuclease P protein component [Opitutaceae bacterium]
MRFRPEQHIRRPGEFRTVREQGQRFDCGAFTLWHRRREGAVDRPRVGVVASTASVGAAVQRNRAKRRLRELFRQHQDLLPAGIDLVLVARSSVNRLDYPALAAKFADACRRLSSTPHA